MNHIMKMKAEQKAAMSRLTPSRKALARKTLAVLAPVLAGGFMLAAPAMAPAQVTAQTAAQSEVLPGYWEYTTNAVGQRETLQKCVRPSEINRFFGGISTNKWRCTYPTRVVGDGNARFEGTCSDHKNRRINVRLSGTYTETSFSFRGGAQVVRGTPYIPASITARRISAQCPANAEYF
ncbi:DUF3617 family protein [Brevundimonas nasdae]|uniref:DUF3617 family protein n=3 Tax=Brevundimonas nasdae TaxID=172043 RepID=A0ABX8TGY3_9CAUL|nr:DUF3617 family protein [Brevundimonas nasdae]QYC15406.1 DUF3617 family protein [Brevundimonas nasdae]